MNIQLLPHTYMSSRSVQSDWQHYWSRCFGSTDRAFTRKPCNSIRK